MYLGLRDVIPDEVWELLWASYTSDLVREHSSDAHDSMDLHRSPKAPRTSHQSSPLLAKKPCHAPSSPEIFVDHTTTMLPSGARRCEDRCKSTQDSYPLDELTNLPELRTRLEGKRERVPDCRDQQYCTPTPMTSSMTPIAEGDDDLHSNADTLRSEAETMASDAMSHWLGKEAVSRAKLSPFEIAHWLRMLPKDRLTEDTLKTVAKKVLDEHIDEDGFGLAVAGGLQSFGLSDQRQGIVLQRYFKQKQNEAAMAEAAKQEGALIRKFNAKLEAKVWQA